jgi:uncharacterized damage-inducible protein DinB
MLLVQQPQYHSKNEAAGEIASRKKFAKIQNAMSPKVANDNCELIRAVTEILQQGERLLAEISDAAYTRKVPVAFNASIGGHYRHCLDHFRNLLANATAGDLNYDQRERGTLVETDRFAALNETRELGQGFAKLDPGCLARTLAVTCKTSHATNGSQTSPSTVGREVMYAVAHAVHHYALIGVMGGISGLKLPAGFGIAPATLQHHAAASKAAA